MEAGTWRPGGLVQMDYSRGMQFRSVNLTTVPDELAELIFLAMATKWPGVDVSILARAFMGASIYNGILPDGFGPASSIRQSNVCAVIVDVDGVEPFRVEVAKPTRGVYQVVVVGQDEEWISQRWHDPASQYRGEERLLFDASARAYEDRHGESHVETLRRKLLGLGEKG